MAEKINPRELEKEFNAIKKEIDLCIHNKDNFSIPDDDLFNKLDIEYDFIKEIYVNNSDLYNLFISIDYMIVKYSPRKKFLIEYLTII